MDYLPVNRNAEKPVRRRRRAAGVTAAAAAFAGVMAISSATPAAADRIEYSWDECGSNVGACLGLFYGGKKNGVIYSACFLTNRSHPDHWGRAEHGRTTRYQFRNQPGHDNIRFRIGVDIRCQADGWGSGNELKNAAASVANQDWVAHDIFFNSYYEGFGRAIGQDESGNLHEILRNNNASSRREDR
ncbi:hypothetical protein [Streptomyces huiliensis]|uniref:hypothetical protein n=1 Tax=Streptomyces huiliensis TaxID=2876027 RepID=UPI001CBF17F3|nr:hypothetical protein [Streptomyces huiliensis]MBZ4320875.1 hypothetical protein [Streptomyces huiliensis]